MRPPREMGRSLSAFFSDNPNMSLLMVGQFISVLGDAFFNIGILLLVYNLTGSRWITGLVGACSYLPILFFGLFAGVVVDQYPYKRMMLLADVVRALLCFLIPMAATAGILGPVFLAFIAFSLSIFSALFIPARDSLVPKLAEGIGLSRANSLVQGSTQAGFLVGPFVGAAVVAYAGPVTLFLADGVTFLASFVIIALIRLRPGSDEPPERTDGVSKTLDRIRADTREVLEYIASNRAIRWVLGVSFLNNIFIMGPATVGMLVFVKDVLGEGDEVYAYAEGMIAGGMLLTSILLAAHGLPMRKGRMWAAGLVADGLTWIPVAFAPTPGVFLLAVFLHAVTIPTLIVPRTTIIQEVAPQRLHGRLFGLVYVTVFGCMGLSVALTGLFSEIMPVKVIFVAIGVIGATTGFVGFFIKEIQDLD